MKIEDLKKLAEDLTDLQMVKEAAGRRIKELEQRLAEALLQNGKLTQQVTLLSKKAEFTVLDETALLDHRSSIEFRRTLAGGDIVKIRTGRGVYQGPTLKDAIQKYREARK